MNDEKVKAAIMASAVRDTAVASANRIVGPTDAEDVVQEAYERALKSLKPGKEVRNPRAWFLKIVYNKALKWIQRSRQAEEVAETISNITPDREVESRRLEQAIQEGISKLPDKKRHVLVKYVFRGHSHQKIAASMGITEGNSRTLFYRAKQALWKTLSKDPSLKELLERTCKK